MTTTTPTTQTPAEKGGSFAAGLAQSMATCCACGERFVDLFDRKMCPTCFGNGGRPRNQIVAKKAVADDQAAHILEIRQQIEDDTYIDDEKIDGAVEELLPEVTQAKVRTCCECKGGFIDIADCPICGQSVCPPCRIDHDCRHIDEDPERWDGMS